MWHQVGFLADAFQIFKAHGLSVDLVSTSETSVTVSLDPAANTLDSDILAALVEELSGLCRVQVIGPCASVSLVGRNIRGILHRLGDAFDLFEEQRIYLVSQAANDLNFTFVVDEDQADRLVNQMHELLVQPVHGDPVLGPTWEQLFARGEGDGAAALVPWWRTERAALLAALGTRDAAYVYHGATVDAAARALTALRSVSRAWYAMKANSHPELLRRIHAAGIGVECVSRGEIEHAKRHIPGITPAQILYTPNFASRDEYNWALGSGVLLTIDSLYPLQHWAELFRGRDLYVRVDSGTGRGHHHHVRTAGAHAKFGVPVEELDELADLARAAGARIVGLHAHPGSGIFDVESNGFLGFNQLGEAARFPDLRSINVGGGLGVPDHNDRPALDLARLDAVLADARAAAVDRVVCLGDVVDLGPQPEETVRRLRDANVAFDKSLEALIDFQTNLAQEQGKASAELAALSAESRAWLEALPMTLEVDLDGARALLAHGSPKANTDSLLASTPEPELDGWGTGGFDLVACGHTHVALTRHHRGRPFVNVGSVGMPFEEPFSGRPPRSIEPCSSPFDAPLRWRRCTSSKPARRRSLRDESIPMINPTC